MAVSQELVQLVLAVRAQLKRREAAAAERPAGRVAQANYRVRQANEMLALIAASLSAIAAIRDVYRQLHGAPATPVGQTPEPAPQP